MATLIKHPYQKPIVPWLVNTPRGALLADMGSGKTVLVGEALDILLDFDEASRVLIIAPKKVTRLTWPDEFRNWNHLSHRSASVQLIRGSHEERLEQTRSLVPIHVINWDLVPWLLEHRGRDWPYDMVVEDESTRCRAHDAVTFRGVPKQKEVFQKEASLQAARAKLDQEHRRYRIGKGRDGRRFIETAPRHGLQHVATKTPRWLLMSGTIADSGYEGLWAQMFRLDGGRRLGGSFTDYLDRFFTPGWVDRKNPWKRGAWQLRPGANVAIMDAIKDISLVVVPDAETEPLVVEVRRFRLTPALMAEYKRLERELFLRIQGREINAANAAVLTGKLQQFTSGFLYTDGGEVKLHDLRRQAYQELLDELEGHPVLVARHFDSTDQWLNGLPGHRALDDKPETLEAWCAGKIPAMVAHPKSGGHGLNLQRGGHHLIFYEVDWPAEDHNQIIERIGPMRQWQSRMKRSTYVYYLIAENTIDEAVLSRLTERKDVSQAFKEYMLRSQVSA